MDFEKFKPMIIELIQYYYINNPTGGCCHIILDEGNLSIEDLLFCQGECEKYGDNLGYLILEILSCFTENEREKMYKIDWWGMNPVE